MSHIHAAVAANLIVIRQGIRLLDALGAARYTQRLPLCFNSTIGGHMRHIIEHYASFLAGLDGAAINYEKRGRDPQIESDPTHATAVLESVATQLTSFADDSGETNAILVFSETSPDGATCAGSSHIRELEFLLSHTIHHYALIAVMARMLGIEPEPTFGIAPSTMRYEQSRSAAHTVLMHRPDAATHSIIQVDVDANAARPDYARVLWPAAPGAGAPGFDTHAGTLPLAAREFSARPGCLTSDTTL